MNKLGNRTILGLVKRNPLVAPLNGMPENYLPLRQLF